MKAVVFHAIGDIHLEEVPKPGLQGPEDAIVRLTTVAICGTDLHLVRGTMAPVTPGTILGHEGVGVVEAVGEQVRISSRATAWCCPPRSPAAAVPTAVPASSRSAT